MFVPMTEDSKLRRTLQEKDDVFSKMHNIPPVRFVEKVGKKLSQLLGTPVPWGGVHSGRQGCTPCNDPTTDAKLAAPKGACSLESCLYSLKCLLCETRDPNENAQYFGESGQSAHSRGREHSESVSK